MMIGFTCYKACKEEQAGFDFFPKISVLVSLWLLRLLRPGDPPVCFVYEEDIFQFTSNPTVP